MHFLKLIRITNLALIFLTQGLMTVAVISPILRTYGLSSNIPYFMLLLLSISTVLLAAGGYCINDYFDTDTDSINKPHRVIPRNRISTQKVLQLYRYLTVGGVLAGSILALMVRSIALGLLFPGIAWLLWYYSSTLKRRVLTATHCQTLPVVAGLRFTRLVLIGLIIFTLAILGYFVLCHSPCKDSLSTYYLLIINGLPLTGLGIFLLKAEKPADFKKASAATKGIMAGGLAYAIVFSIQLSHYHHSPSNIL